MASGLRLRQSGDGIWWQQSADGSWAPCEFDLTQAPDGLWWVKTREGHVEVLDPQPAPGDVGRTAADLRVPQNIADAAKAGVNRLGAPFRAAIATWRDARHPWITVGAVIVVVAAGATAKVVITNHNDDNQRNFWAPKLANDAKLVVAAIQEVSRLDDLYGDDIDPSSELGRDAALVRAAQDDCMDKARAYLDDIDAAGPKYVPADLPRAPSLTECWSRWPELQPGFQP